MLTRDKTYSRVKLNLVVEYVKHRIPNRGGSKVFEPGVSLANVFDATMEAP